jgi:uncharacterized protein
MTAPSTATVTVEASREHEAPSTTEPIPMRASFPARVLMLPIRAWRLISVHLPPRCRFHPSCSQYALDALTIHGAARGTLLAIRRVGRCHPWHEGGLDPVPDPRPHVRSSRRAGAHVTEER